MTEPVTREVHVVPDPTSLTTAALTRASAAERDYVNGQLDVVRERFRGIDEAARLLAETVNRAPTDVTQQVGHLRELTDERFKSVDKQFGERDTRSERESRDNKVAVDAAFAAQKEAASEQNKSNTLAISKSEAATAETLNKLSELFKSTTDALADKIDDVKTSQSSTQLLVNGLIQRGSGGSEANTTAREAAANLRATIAVVISVLFLLLSIASLIGFTKA
jgi:hypothetical protein